MGHYSAITLHSQWQYLTYYCMLYVESAVTLNYDAEQNYLTLV